MRSIFNRCDAKENEHEANVDDFLASCARVREAANSEGVIIIISCIA